MSAATVSDHLSANDAHRLNHHIYMELYLESINHPDIFWRREAKRISWDKPFKTVKNTSFMKDRVSIQWFEEGALNACYNCIDRHLPASANKVAYHWEPDTPGQGRSLTYQQLYDETCRLANALRSLGINKGDTVAIYLPMIPEAVLSMLACARIGAVHCVIYAGYAGLAVADRIKDCGAKLVITADEGLRGGKTIPLKNNMDMALGMETNHQVEHVIVVKHSGAPVNNGSIDRDYQDLISQQAAECPPVLMNAEDPLFILYTSGSTGKPKGAVHSTGGYLVYASITHQYVFDFQKSHVFWCGADIGWITGHTYITYGPLLNGATSVMFEGLATHPNLGRYGEIIDKYKVSTFYVAPTAIRALMAGRDQALTSSDRSSLHILATAGEPINPQAWHWFNDHFGKGRCQILDTWWQTETGGIMISPLPGATPLKPGSATRPFFGIKPALVSPNGRLLAGQAEGALVMLDSWPGQMRTLYNDHERFEQTYFSLLEGTYYTGDRARMDEDGYFWITGRMDDVLIVSGYRLGTAEIENCLVSHAAIAEAAVVGVPDDRKGHGIYVFVTPVNHVNPNKELAQELTQKIKKELSSIATPDTIQWTHSLPRTRSGKIMRHILRRIACDQTEDIGDLSALANPTVVDDLIEQHKLL